MKAFSIYLDYQGTYEKMLHLGEFQDLKELDLKTISYTEVEFLKEISFYYPYYYTEYMNFFISKEKSHKTYPCIFYNNNTQIQKMLELLKCYLSNTKCFKLYHELVNYILQIIVSNHRIMLEITSSSSVDFKLKEYLRLCQNSRSYIYYYPKIMRKLSSYLILRSLILEYQHIFIPSKVKHEFIGLWNLEEIHLLNEGYHSFFSNEEVSLLYKKGGTNLVLSELDGNDIYSLPISDLLKLGLISEEQYLSRKKHV